MSDLKRRKLGDNRSQNQRHQNQNPKPQNQQQQNQRPQQQNQQRRRPPQRQPQRPPPPPPAYMQRDLLLITTEESATPLEAVRAKFDPLSKKLPAHITLVFPEPAKMLDKEFLKTLGRDKLPSITSINFSQIIVHDEMYLWLMPDDEGREKLLTWQTAMVEAMVSQNPEHTQEDVFTPHITLGYVPRRLTPEEAIAQAQELVKLPLTVHFGNILLEEFSENQVSTTIDSLLFDLPTESAEHPDTK